MGLAAPLLCVCLKRHEKIDAIAEKIDAIAAGMADLMEYQRDPDPDRLARHIEEIRAAIRLEQRL